MTLAGVTLAVEVAFTAAPFDASPSWTDITGYVKSVATKRGRSNEVGMIEAGTATVVLDNADGRFTPQRATSPSPYAGNIAPRRQVRITAVVDSVTKPVWRGYTERWSLTHPGGGDYAEAALECVDGLKLLGDHKLLDFYGEYIRSTGPTAYYPLTEAGGSRWFADRAQRHASGLLYHRSWNDKSTAGSDALLSNSGGTSVSFDSDGTSAGADLDLTGALDAVAFDPSGWSMAAWLKLSSDYYDQSPPTPPPDPTAPPAPNPDPNYPPDGPTIDPPDPTPPTYPPGGPTPPDDPSPEGPTTGPPAAPGHPDAPTPDADTPAGPTVPGAPQNVVVTLPGDVWAPTGSAQRLVFQRESLSGTEYPAVAYPDVSGADQQIGACNEYLTYDDANYFTTDRWLESQESYGGFPPRYDCVVNNDTGNALLATGQDWAHHSDPSYAIDSDGAPIWAPFRLSIVLEGAGRVVIGMGTVVFDFTSVDGKVAYATDHIYAPEYNVTNVSVVWHANDIKVHQAWVQEIAVTPGGGDNVTWDAPEDDGGGADDGCCSHATPGIDQYRVVNTQGDIVYLGPDLACAMTTDPAGPNYVRVQAHNSMGWGPFSAWSPSTLSL